jgi:perosamine synthetase
MTKLAMFGGPRAVGLTDADRQSVAWPVVTGDDREAVRRIMDEGGFTSIGSGAATVQAFEEAWAEFTGTRHCAAVASGTAAIGLALAAAGVEPGAEILVPALSFVASAAAPAERLIVPVFVDVDPVTYTLDPVAAEAAITPRTRAILAVHLHGLPCDMTALRALADRHGLLLVEDAAQAHGATYRGRRTGSLGDVACFSLNPSKNLPTCGEGGMVTTSDAGLHRQVVRYRQFGEDIEGRRRYISRVIAGNAKISAIEAAFAHSQLQRLPEAHEARCRNVTQLLKRLAELPGLVVPHTPEDRTHAWHIIRLRIDPAAMGVDVPAVAMRKILQRALRAEGVPVKEYQSLPLPAQPAFAERAGFGGYPWRLSPETQEHECPNTTAVLGDSFTLQGWHLNPASGAVLERCADGFEKAWQHREILAVAASGGASS